MGRTFQCQECDYEATLQTNLHLHIKSTHRDDSFKCPECDFIAVQSRFHLKRHIRSIHRGEKIQCPKCDYKSGDKYTLQKHIKSIHKGNNFPCPGCYKAKQKGELQRHIETIHSDEKLDISKFSDDYKAVSLVAQERSSVEAPKGGKFEEDSCMDFSFLQLPSHM